MTASDGQSLGSTFKADHDRLSGLLEDALRLTSYSKSVSARATFERFATDLRRHMETEDRFLFPRFEQQTGMQERGPTLMLRREHHEIESRLALITAALRSKDNTKASSEMQALTALLEDHRRREETLLYATCDRLLDPTELDVAARALSTPRPDGK